MHSRICLAAIVAMVIGAASSGYYPRWAYFWDDGLLKNKLRIPSDSNEFELDLYDWFKRGETELDLPKSTQITLDALHVFLSSANLKSYYDILIHSHRFLRELSDAYVKGSMIEMIKKIKAFLTPKEMALENCVKHYLDCRENAKKERREAELAVRIVYDNTEPNLFLRAEETKKAAERARLEAIEAQKDLGIEYRSVYQFDQYEATALLNTSLLAFMTMLEQKMQEENAFGALKLVPSLTDAFKLEVLSREILSAIPKIEIIDWLEEEIKKNMYALFGVNQKSLPGSTTGTQSPLSVAELATGKIEDLRDYVFTITLLENLPVLFEMARGGIQDMKLTSEAYELFIANIRDLLIANVDPLKAANLNETKPEIEDPKSTEWSSILQKLTGITPTQVRPPRSIPHSSTTAFEAGRLSAIDTQILNLRDEIDFVKILAIAGKNLFSKSFKVDLIREKLREMTLLVATMRVLNRQDVYDIIRDAKESIPVKESLNRSILKTTNPQLIEAIFKRLQERLFINLHDMKWYGRNFYLYRLFPTEMSESFSNYLELTQNKLLSTDAEWKVQIFSVMNELVSLAGKHFSKSSTLERIDKFYDEAFVFIFDKQELLLGFENDIFDLIQNYCKHRYHLPASKNLKRISEVRFSKMVNQTKEFVDFPETSFLYDAFQFVSRQPATSDDHGLTIFLAQEHVNRVVNHSKNFFYYYDLNVLSKQADKSRLFETGLLNFDANLGFFDDLYAFTLRMNFRSKDFETWNERFNFYLDNDKTTKNYLLFKLLGFIIFKPNKEIQIQMPGPDCKDAIVSQTVEILEKNAESGFSKIVAKIHEKMMKENLGAPPGGLGNLSDMVTDFFGKSLKSAWLRDIQEMKSVEPIPWRKVRPHWNQLKI